MHELSLVQNLFAQLEALLQENNATRITIVRVEIGPFAGVVIDAFEFAFTAVSSSTPWADGARLELTTPKPRYQCLCGAVEERESLEPGSCTQCGDDFLTPFPGGSDIILQQVEME